MDLNHCLGRLDCKQIRGPSNLPMLAKTNLVWLCRVTLLLGAAVMTRAYSFTIGPNMNVVFASTHFNHLEAHLHRQTLCTAQQCSQRPALEQVTQPPPHGGL